MLRNLCWDAVLTLVKAEEVCWRMTCQQVYSTESYPNIGANCALKIHIASCDYMCTQGSASHCRNAPSKYRWDF